MGQLDQAVLIHPDEWAELDEVDEVITASLLEGSPDRAMAMGRYLYRSRALVGLKLAKLLWKLKEVWNSFQTGEEIQDYIYREMGVWKNTFRQYTDVMEYIVENEKIPAPIRQRLAGKPMGGLIPLIGSAKEERFTEAVWREISNAPDKASMLAIRDREMGKEPKQTIGITWDKESGALTAWQEGQEPAPCGFLPPDDQLVSELARKARDSILTKRGISEVVA